MTGSEQVRTGVQELQSVASDIADTTARSYEESQSQAAEHHRHIAMLADIERTRLEKMRQRDDNNFRNTQDWRDRMLMLAGQGQGSSGRTSDSASAVPKRYFSLKKDGGSLEADLVVNNFKE